MQYGAVLNVISFFARGLEMFGVAVIIFSFLHAMLRGLLELSKGRPYVYQGIRGYMGRALQLALEFLIAADIIRTVIVEPNIQNLLLLGILVLVRTFLSWSITVEIEGCWPWQVASRRLMTEKMNTQ